MSFLIGPIFFLLLETSIRDGIKSALILDFGVFWSDLIYILVAYHFTQDIIDLKQHENMLATIGGVIFILFGVYNFRKDSVKKVKEKDLGLIKYYYPKLIVKGFVINMVNPSVLFYWFGVIVLGYTKNNYTPAEMWVYISTILISFFSIDVLKIIGAGQLKKVVTPGILMKVNRVTGLIMAAFGVVMIIKGLGLIK